MSDRRLNVAQLDAIAHIEANTPCMMWGSPGIGKSAMFMEIAAEKGIPLIDIRLSQRDAVALLGIPFPNRETRTTEWFPPYELPNAERHGPEGLLLLDELNACERSVQVAAYQLILDRQLGEYHVPPGWRICAAGNKLTDKAAASKLSTALNNRMAHIDVEVDHDAWCDWAITHGIDPMLVGFIRFRRELLHKMPDGAREFCSPRSWEMANRYMGQARHDRIRRIGQCVGAGPAGELEAFAEIAGRLEPVAYILANPTTAKIPAIDAMAALYAVTMNVAYAIDRKTAAAGATYAARLPAEFKALFAQSVLMRDKSLASYGFAKLINRDQIKA